jgi:ABC-type uncharacterized transport system permease subunit
MKANEALKPTEVLEMTPPEAAQSRSFFIIVRGSTALALGCMAAVLEALRRDADGFTIHVSAGTFVAFAAGFAAGLYFWKMAARSLLAARVGIALLLLAGLGGFLYPLRFVPSDKRADIATGLFVAACAVSTGAVLLWKMKRFFDKDAAAAETEKVN